MRHSATKDDCGRLQDAIDKRQKVDFETFDGKKLMNHAFRDETRTRWPTPQGFFVQKKLKDKPVVENLM